MAYTRAQDPEVRSALADGVITRAEYEAANQRYVACAADKGVVIDLIDQGGLYAYSFRSAPGADDVVASCDYLAEDVSALYSGTTRNPDNEDFSELVTACLIRLGVVDPTYTAEQLRSDMDAGTEPFRTVDDDVTPEGRQCLSDPGAG